MSPQQTYGRFQLRIVVAFVVTAILVLTASAVHSAVRSHDYGSPAVLQLRDGPGGPRAESTALERAADGPYGPAVRLQLRHGPGGPRAASTALERAADGPYGPAVRLQLGQRPGGSAVTSEK